MASTIPLPMIMMIDSVECACCGRVLTRDIKAKVQLSPGCPITTAHYICANSSWCVSRIDQQERAFEKILDKLSQGDGDD